MDGACGATAEALNLVPRLRSLRGDQSPAFDLVVTHTFGGEHRSEPRVGASVRLPARNARPGVLGPRLQRFDDTDRWPVYAAPFTSQAVGLGSYQGAPLALETPDRWPVYAAPFTSQAVGLGSYQGAPLALETPDRWPVYAAPFTSQAVGLGSYQGAPLALETPDRWPVYAAPFTSQPVGLGSYQGAPLALRTRGFCGDIGLRLPPARPLR
jgi:hypothetical protein